MTRKDFLMLSTAIRATVDRIEVEDGQDIFVDPQIVDAQLRGVWRTAAHIADALLAEHGARFDAQRFLIDCGFGGTTK
jgi:hypothetical protein